MVAAFIPVSLERGVSTELKIALLEQALRRTRQSNHSQVGTWLLEQFQQ